MRRNGKQAPSSNAFASLVSRVVMIGVAILLVTSAKLWISAISHASGGHSVGHNRHLDDEGR